MAFPQGPPPVWLPSSFGQAQIPIRPFRFGRYLLPAGCLYMVESALDKPVVLVSTGGNPNARREGAEHESANEILRMVAGFLGERWVLDHRD